MKWVFGPPWVVVYEEVGKYFSFIEKDIDLAMFNLSTSYNDMDISSFSFQTYYIEAHVR